MDSVLVTWHHEGQRIVVFFDEDAGGYFYYDAVCMAVFVLDEGAVARMLRG
ncbi:MAG: hypothetical protein Q4P66_01055 [Actinomycetaceae bacterium]|nr:hypothetical protein [Actinomycetaceae bacterium]